MSTLVPSLVTARPLPEALEWRTAAQHEGLRGAATGLITDGASRVATPALRAGELDVVGLLGPDALESIAWAAESGVNRAYADLAALLTDRISVAAIDLPAPRADVLVGAAAAAGLSVLMTTPRVGDAALLTEALFALQDNGLADAVVFVGRSDPAYGQVAEHAAELGAIRQLTALRWPAGMPPRAELIDLVRRWCGDIVAVCADPAAMPAQQLAADEPVTLALLTEPGTTVLAGERFASRQADALLTLTGEHGRLVLSGRLLTVGGKPVPVRRGDPGAAITLAARTLNDSLRSDDPPGARLTDLIVAGHVLSAIELSRTDGGWVEVDGLR